MTRIFLFIAGVAAATPALAYHPAHPVPEPDAMALFALSTVGLIIGRYSSRKRPPRDDA